MKSRNEFRHHSWWIWKQILYAIWAHSDFATFIHERLKWTLVSQSRGQTEIDWLCVDVAGYKITKVLHARDLHLEPSRRFHTPACLLATTTARMSAGVTALHLLTLIAWPPGQQPTTLINCWTNQPVLSRMKSRHHPGPDICCVDQDSRLLGKRVLANVFAITALTLFLNTILRLIIPAYTDSVKRWNFCKEALLSSSRRIRCEFPTSGQANIEKLYQELCDSLLICG